VLDQRWPYTAGNAESNCWKQAQRISVAVKDARDHARNKECDYFHKPESEVLILRPRKKKGHKAREQQGRDGWFRFEKKHQGKFGIRNFRVLTVRHPPI